MVVSTRKGLRAYDFVARGFVIAGVILEAIGGTRHSVNVSLLVGIGLMLLALAIVIGGRMLDRKNAAPEERWQASSVSDWYRSRRQPPER